MTDGQRNILIVLVIAAIVMAFSLGNLVAGLFQILGIIFMILIVATLVQFYRRNQTTINSMDLGPRIVLLGSGIAMVLVVFSASIYPRWGNGGGSSALFFILLGLCGLGMWWGWQQRSSW